MRQGENNRFGCVNDRTTAECDNQIRVAAVHQLHPSDHGSDIRIGDNVIPHLPVNAARTETLRDTFSKTEFDHRLIGNQQNMTGG
ncbi:hypothetical protein ExPUPEC61_03161 [Escherichia coli]|nr:hypothetical protein ExPUPEC61_03161 [Escherichia coli]